MHPSAFVVLLLPSLLVATGHSGWDFEADANWQYTDNAFLEVGHELATEEFDNLDAAKLWCLRDPQCAGFTFSVAENTQKKECFFKRFGVSPPVSEGEEDWETYLRVTPQTSRMQKNVYRVTGRDAKGDPIYELESENGQPVQKQTAAVTKVKTVKKCSITCELVVQKNEQGKAVQVISAMHDATTGNTHHICYKNGCAATDSIGCECYCDCSDDGVHFYTGSGKPSPHSEFR
jgi:hypothetical protein